MYSRIFKQLIISILATATIILIFLYYKNASPYFIRMTVNLYQGDSPREPGILEKLNAGQRVKIKEEHSQWVLVKAGSIEGWLPKWYLTRNPDDIQRDISPNLMVVKEQVSVCLYPDASAAVSSLHAGSVVKVEQVYNNWSYVLYQIYDIPKVMRGWVQSGFLGTREEATPMEGIILSGAKVYYGEPGQLREEILTLDEAVHIVKEEGPMVYVQGAGGWVAWVYKEDIVFDLIITRFGGYSN
ncbi:MAG: SH3 domain-containing protein [Eubacteriales bacterium]